MDKGNCKGELVYTQAEYLNTQQDAIELLVLERERQRDKWGDQAKLPLSDELLIFGEEYGEFCKAELEGDTANSFQELVEAAACLLQMIERRIHRQNASQRPPRMPCHYSDYDGGEHY